MGVAVGLKLANPAAFKAAMLKTSKNVTKVLPYTLTQCAFEGRKELMAKLPAYIHKPTSATTRGVYYEKAKPAGKPYSQVKFSPLAWKWMKFSVLGGTRRGTAPVDATKNSYGNVVPSQRARNVLSKRNAERMTINGTDGIWLREKGSMRLMHVYKDSMQYQKRLPMQFIVYKKAASVFKQKFAENMRSAIKRGVGG